MRWHEDGSGSPGELLDVPARPFGPDWMSAGALDLPAASHDTGLAAGKPRRGSRRSPRRDRCRSACLSAVSDGDMGRPRLQPLFEPYSRAHRLNLQRQEVFGGCHE
jgi:hypothetical protein